MASAQHRVFSLFNSRCLATKMLCLGTLMALVTGCGSSADSQPVAVVQDEPVREFEWGMERLERALRLFRPSSAEGLHVSERKMDYELFPPDDAQPGYTARVTVTTKTTFLHARRQPKKEEKAEATAKELEIDDPLADKSDELNRLVEIPGTGPGVPAVADAKIEPRKIASQSVFNLAYLEGHWQLTHTPEKKHEQYWFEYAFD